MQTATVLEIQTNLIKSEIDSNEEVHLSVIIPAMKFSDRRDEPVSITNEYVPKVTEKFIIPGHDIKYEVRDHGP